MIAKAIKAALEAGDAILEIYSRDFEVEYKADASPLTEADRTAHNIIVRNLEGTSFPVLSEESREIPAVERRSWKCFWMVDPLDGTKEFIRKNGEFTVNIALVKNKVPILGIVYVPVAGILYLGVNGYSNPWNLTGAWKAARGKDFQGLEDLLEKFPGAGRGESGIFQRLEISGPLRRPPRVAASKSHCNDTTRNFIAEIEEKYGEIELVSKGSSLKLCMVAEGTADIYPRLAPTMEWDTAAAQAVVEASGGRVVQYDPEIPAPEYLNDIGDWSISANQGAHQTSGLRELTYNKAELLNPFFVVSRS